MKIPKCITIGGIKYKIKRVKENGDYRGICRLNQGVIEIVENLPEDSQEKTLIHEILHAIFYEYGVTMSSKAEEELIRKIETGVYEAFKQLEEK